MSQPVAVLAIADPSLRQRLGQNLARLHWQVIETACGAEALAQLEARSSAAIILDRWLPDLDVQEVSREVQSSYPQVDLISVDGSFTCPPSSRSGRRGELMHAIRLSQEWDGAAHVLARDFPEEKSVKVSLPSAGLPNIETIAAESAPLFAAHSEDLPAAGGAAASAASSPHAPGRDLALAELLGAHPSMLEVGRRVRLVAPRSTTVLVHGPSGTGKELVARAIHRLSPRAGRPFVVLNCAAIPESLLEAELFGHTRGAFTGAVQRRVGRIESAHGGTLFLDEIGEMPLALQSKLLRFLEAGEIQRVGDNELLTVDVRVVAATHQPLHKRVREGTFREDLFYRLAVFLIRTPALAEHAADIPLLAQFFLRRLSENSPAKRLEPSALHRLTEHAWPGNVRELAHAIERAYILAETRTGIVADDIEFENPEEAILGMALRVPAIEEREVNDASIHATRRPARGLSESVER